jgi:hypothetical protein
VRKGRVAVGGGGGRVGPPNEVLVGPKLEALFGMGPVSYTHLRAHETTQYISYAVFCLKKNFFNDTATTEIYT